MKAALTIPLLALFGMETAFSAETITVDFGEVTGPATQRACGFLHSLTPDLPPDDLVVPLKLRMSRMGPGSVEQKNGAFGCHERVVSLGAMHQIVVSDGHGYGRSGWPGDDGDWSRWEDLVAGMVRQASEAGYDLEWDIWNEPDIAQFWNPAPDDPAAQWERFKETWTRGYRIIRDLNPDAVIVGPSNSGFDTNLFSVIDFLAFAHELDVLPDLVSWHEWHPSRIVPHVEETRAFMEENGIPEIPISINEYVTHPHQTEPGILAWYLAALEEAEVHSAAHACWPEPDGASNCRRPQLDGILTPEGKEPRSTWWVYRTYAAITGNLVRVEPGDTTHSIGGYDPQTGEARILLGRKGDAEASVEIQISGLDRAPALVDPDGDIRVTVERIPDSGWEELSMPAFVFGGRYRAEDGNLKIRLPAFGPTDAYSVALRPIGE
jgi:hypothetical protein